MFMVNRHWFMVNRHWGEAKLAKAKAIIDRTWIVEPPQRHPVTGHPVIGDGCAPSPVAADGCG
jgi:hypothetical protein